MQAADGLFMCRVGFVETLRAVTLVAGPDAGGPFAAEWPAFGVVELDQQLAQAAASLALRYQLCSLDALHLAAALVLPQDELVFATWDRRLHGAAEAEGIAVLPATPP
jgi:predicted nucleic acid-binding protein